jgi:hypothetical protein
MARTKESRTVATTTDSPATVTPKAAAAALGISAGRLSQLTKAGAIQPDAGGRIDLAQAAVALLERARRDDSGRKARERYLRATAVAAELRVRRELRQLMTVDECKELITTVVVRARTELQASSSGFFYEIQAEHGEQHALIGAGRFYRSVLGALVAADRTAREVLRRARDEQLPREARIEDVFASLAAAVQSAGDDDAADDAEGD